MTSTTYLAATTVLVLTAAVVAGAIAAVAARRLTEPAGAGDKPSYRSLATPGFAIGCGLLATAAMLLAAATLPGRVLAPWWVLAALVVPLVAFDARTTWLPLPLVRLGWVAMAVAAVATAAVRADWSALGRTAAGAAAVWAVYAVVWRIRPSSIGFGDVRLAPLLGGATAAHSWSMMIAALVLGSLAGAVQGVVRLVRRRTGVYPYAPSMLVGPYAAAVITWLG